ncbi:MAG: beta-lactamase family protein [Gemmatimonadota bacterium]|nr:beta-lactamase family protein [Gemmatimonadota bacterium]
MKLIRFAAGALLVAALVQPAVLLAQVPGLEERIDAVFLDFEESPSPGCAVGVIRDGSFLFQKGYGYANLETATRNSPETIFRIGSTSKQFTAAAMVLLEQDGVLSLDDDIRRLLPEMPEYDATITIRHLLTHTSGLRDYLTLMYLAGKRDDDFYTDDEVLDIIGRQQGLNFLPGEEYLYSNSGYFLLSQIVKRASGMSLRRYAAENIFEPLGMRNTHFHDRHTEVVVGRADGYAPEEDGFQKSMTTLGMIGDGGVFTSVSDLLQWDRNFYDPRLGGQEFLQRMLKRGILNNGDSLPYALGLRHGIYRGLATVSHGGAFVGFRAEMMRFPTVNTSIAVLCNVSNSNPTRRAMRVADIVLENFLGSSDDGGISTGVQSNGRAVADAAVPPPEPYVGRYFSRELNVEYEIRAAGDGVELAVGNDLDGPLLMTLPEVLVKPESVVTLRFFAGSAGSGQYGGFFLDAGRVRNVRFERR